MRRTRRALPLLLVLAAAACSSPEAEPVVIRSNDAHDDLAADPGDPFEPEVPAIERAVAAPATRRAREAEPPREERVIVRVTVDGTPRESVPVALAGLPSGFVLALTDGRGVATLVLREPRAEIQIDLPGFARVRQPVALVAAELNIAIELVPVATVEGRVLDETSAPIEGATVKAFFDSAVIARTETASDGSFVLDGLERGHAYRVIADKPERPTQTVEVLAPVVSLTLVLAPRANIALEVGEGVEGLSYLVERRVRDRWIGERVGSASGPPFTIDGVIVGAIRVRTIVPQRGWACSEAIAGLDARVIVRPAPGRRIVGRIVAGDGRPVQAFVELADWPARTASGRDGRFVLEDVPREEVRLDASCEGFARGHAVVGPDTEDMGDLVLSPAR